MKNLQILLMLSAIFLVACGTSTIQHTKTTLGASVSEDSNKESCPSDDYFYIGAIDILPVTPAEKRAFQDFLDFDVLKLRLEKYHLANEVDEVDLMFLPNILSKRINEDNIIIHLSETGVDYIEYAFLSHNRDNNPANAHKILYSEKQELIKYLSLVTDDQKKSKKILNQLYQDYQKKLINKELTRNHLVVADVESDGRIFELVGKVEINKKQPWCSYNRLEKLVIK